MNQEHTSADEPRPDAPLPPETDTPGAPADPAAHVPETAPEAPSLFPVPDAPEPEPAEPPGEAPPSPPDYEYAHFMARVAARYLDGFVLMVPTLPVFVVWYVLLIMKLLNRAQHKGLGRTVQYEETPGLPPELVMVMLGGVWFIVFAAFVIALPLAYQIIWDAKGGTYGKRWLKYRRIDLETGAPPGLRKSARRSLLYAAPSVVAIASMVSLVVNQGEGGMSDVVFYLSVPTFIACLGLTYTIPLYALFNPRRQALHDKLANTAVIRV